MAASPDRPIAILGGTSRIAEDFVLTRSASSDVRFVLFGRRPAAISAFCARHDLADRHEAAPLADFPDGDYQAVINFIGVGDPARAREMGGEIFDVTLTSDQMALDYVRERPDTRYVFASSGAAYGGAFQQAADGDTPASFPINTLAPADYYGLAKLHAEGRHRAMSGTSIIDIRIFNYVSRHMDLSSRFLLTDMINAVRNRTTFETDRSEIIRDFITPADLTALFDIALSAPAGSNLTLDAYTSAPIKKSELIQLMIEEFGLTARYPSSVATINATGAKRNYYSTNRAAEALGYTPRHSSRSGIIEEVRALLAG